MFPNEFSYVWLAINEYWKGNRDSSSVAPIESLSVIAKNLCPEKSWPVVESLLRAIGEIPVDQPKVVYESIADYVIKQGLYNLVMQVASDLDRTNIKIDPGLIRRELDKLYEVKSRQDLGMDYTTLPSDYFHVLDEGRISTGIADIDSSLGGGLGAGELGVLVAPFGGGKTAALVNLGAYALLDGRYVMHMTLEISKYMVAMRYDMRMMNATTAMIRQHPNLSSDAREMVADNDGLLVIEDHSHEKVTPIMVENLLEANSGRFGRPVDMLLVDYADLLHSDGQIGERRLELGSVYQELRRLAALFGIPIWTASQATREASRTGVFGASDVAEDISKMHTADAVLCLIQDPRQREMGQMTLNVAKTRMSNDKPSVDVYMDYRTMTMRPVDRAQQLMREVISGDRV